MSSFTQKAQTRILHSRKIRDDSLPSFPTLPATLPLDVTDIPAKILTEKELEITGLDPVELVKFIGEGKFSCVEVTEAFLRRAGLAQRLVNCLTQLLPTEALSRAKYLDSLPAEKRGPLHGLPISVKEHQGMRGQPTNGSYVAWVGGENDPCGERYGVNDAMWGAGCVFYARTTQPQAIMHLETETNIYGRTDNPWNTNLTPGGSSGGESALVSLRGSILGIGGDIGGSIRCPAANCGVYGFKPTPGRVSKLGSRVAVVGQEGIFSTAGPLSTTASGLSLFMSTYLSTSPWTFDPSLVPLPWRTTQLPPPPQLKIAVLYTDNIVLPHPPITLALKTVASSLLAAGIQIVPWKAVGHDECWDLTQALYYEDGGRAVCSLIEEEGGETLLPLTEWLIKGNKNVKYRTVEDIWELKRKRNAYRQMYNDLWMSTGKEDGKIVDAILCPTGPGAAPKHGNSKYWSYTSQWNLLEYPGAVFPVGRIEKGRFVKGKGLGGRIGEGEVGEEVREEVEREWKEHVVGNESDGFNRGLWQGKEEEYEGAPVGLQVVTRRWEDEKCLEVLRVIEKALGR